MPDLPTGTVTMLFTDIEGSTRLLQQLGEHYAELVATCRQILRGVFQRWHGQEVDTQGDAFFVAFVRATDAVWAAVEMQRTLVAHAWLDEVTVRVRIGLHTGQPLLSNEGYLGLDVHHAARIMNAGHGGQVLLSATTQELVKHDLPDGVSLHDLGEYRLKDLQHPSRLFQVVIANLPADFPPLKTLDSHPNNLPIQPTSLIGREKEMVAVERLLRREDVRLLTLTGPGGIGKTRLGLQVAAELSECFLDGVYFVNLAPISDPDFVVPRVAQTLDVKEIAGHALLDLLKTSLRDKHLLLLLDNFEQVVSAAIQVADLLATCAKLKMVVTSRMALRLQAEHEFTVPPLTLPDPRHLPDLEALSQYEAVALFIVRAQAVKPEFQVTNASAPAVAEICVRLDGLPLAIELAAARIKLFPPQALLARLGQRLAVLTSGARDMPARQQTLRNTIAWSYLLLEVQEQQLFRRLSVFAGGCTLEAIEAVCAALEKSNGAGEVLDSVASLLDKSLLHRREPEGDEPRLFMLETVREYALEAFASSGEVEATRQAHATYYLKFAQGAPYNLYGAEEQTWFARGERDHENLRAALDWLLERREAELALQLCNALWWFWLVQSHLSEGCTFLEKALTASGEVARAVRGEALKGLGLLLMNLGDNERAEMRLEESLALHRELGDTVSIGWSLQILGLALINQGENTRARALFEESLARFSEIGHKAGRAWALCNLASLYTVQGEFVTARSCAEESLALFRELEDNHGITTALLYLANALFDAEGDTAPVDAVLKESLTLARVVGDESKIASIVHLAAKVALGQDDVARARSLIEESLAFDRAKGYRADIAIQLIVLGRVAAAEGDPASAQACYEESLAIARETRLKVATAPSLEGLAALRATQGAFPWAARLWGAAEALRETLGTPLSPRERASYEREVNAVRTQYGEKDFAAVWAQGRAMTPEQALSAEGKAVIPTLMPARGTDAPLMKPPTYPDGLTAREVEVLRLVAQGLMNDQVAEQLVISPRTVNTHLTSIYSKIQVSSRSAATRYAIERKLV